MNRQEALKLRPGALILQRKNIYVITETPVPGEPLVGIYQATPGFWATNGHRPIAFRGATTRMVQPAFIDPRGAVVSLKGEECDHPEASCSVARLFRRCPAQSIVI